MKLLLDTHTFIWSIVALNRLPAKSLKEIQNTANDVFVSSVALWEISIKFRLGKLNLVNITTIDLISSALNMGFTLIDLTPEEAVTQGSLKENSHFDPFDRMIVWQAIRRELTLVSGDPEFTKFKADGLKLLWK
jgi:PIN domain nuclease of toxin-antitoxin system